MALTRVTSGVLGSNAVSAEKLANGSITSRTLGNNSIELRHLTSSANFTGSINTVQSNLTANNIQFTANLNTTSSNIASITTNVNIVSGNISGVAANTIQNKANVDTALDNVVQIVANLDIVSANVNTITSDSATTFTVNKTFEQNVVIQGNLIVVGSQVDLGVGTATIDDNFIVVSANLTGTPATDSGIIINRGSEGNTFIGDHIGDEGVVFAKTLSPHDNSTIAISEYLDIHANAFHAESAMNFSRVHLGHVDDESTGIIIDTTNNHIKFIASGGEEGNITADGDMIIVRDFIPGNAVIAPSVFAGGINVEANLNDLSSNAESVSQNLQANIIQLTANINLVNQNVDSGVGLVKTINSAVSTGSSNVFFVKTPTAPQIPSDLDKVEVYIDGIRQRPDQPGTSNNDYVYSSADASVTLTDPAVPSGLTIIIDALCPRP
tara:strand:- start:7384 stop:8700 length:1317 start_codon:yes stop_codon:yes gene_type:complete